MTMRRVSRGVLALLLAAGLTGTAAQAVQAAPAAGDIADRLKAIPGMQVEERTSTIAGVRWFWLTYRQPVDHKRPHGRWFEQRLMLQHKSEDRPVVLYTSGYNTPETMFTAEPTTLVDGNQISLEHRYFTPSRPEPADWTKDTIWQAATDEHRLIGALKKIYKRKWISTGGSKGGMTGVYHKRFYPGDVDGSVVYVAPNDSDNDEDSRYDEFFRTVGTDDECRAHLKNLAREFLKRRPAMLKRFKAEAARNGWTFSLLRTPDRAFENSVMDYEWAFWQYSLQTDCPDLPPLDASDDDLYASLDAISGLSFYTDQGLSPYIPYYYQAGTQLGWPTPQFTWLRPLLRYESSYQPRTYVPMNIPMRFDGGRAMRDIDRWVRNHGSRLMFIYGENDPWGSERFRLGKGSTDSAVYTAPGMNHSARLITRLPADQQAKAIADLNRWAGTTPSPQLFKAGPNVETDPLRLQRPPL
ncbi:S28 family serine protease [Actinomadura sp. SCN-SB]|uniref:S28 family serine protease n=1 Tax=Actinomadura sp. SCN-SB TaxID=3373092 RepID=UPI003752063A